MKRKICLLTALMIAVSPIAYHFASSVKKQDSVCIEAAAASLISENGISLIKEFEGFLQYAQWDYKQWTIGYGTGVDKDAYPDGITEAEADRLLREVVVVYEGYVQNFLNKYNITVTQNQYDALVSFTYNMGNVWINSDEVTIRTYLINGISNYSPEQIKEAFKMWCKAGGEFLPGLLRRREREADLFLSDLELIPQVKGEYWRVTSSTGVRFRKDCVTTSEIFGVIPYNTVIIAEEKKECDGFLWGRVKINDIYGWCVLDYAEHISGSIETTVIPDSEEKIEKWRITSETGVNLRFNHSTDDQVLDVIPCKTEITVYEKVQKDSFVWARTEYNGKVGWCVLNYAEQIWPVPEDKLESIRIDRLPDKVVYTSGELFESTGMKIIAKYSSGREDEITEYGCSGNTILPGMSTVTIDYKGLTCELTVLVNPVPGDANKNGTVDPDDTGILRDYLLNAEDEFCEWETGDMNGDGTINIIDFIYMKNHIIYNSKLQNKI